MQRLLLIAMLMVSIGLFAQEIGTNAGEIPAIKVAAEPANIFYAADQSVLIMPTAYTMEKGTNAFTDYELFGLQYSRAITNSAHITAAMVFPITSEMFRTFTLGFKYNYFQSGIFQSAVWGSYIIDPNLMSVGNVFSIGSPQASLHLGGAWGTDFKDYGNTFVVMLGGMKDLSPKIAVLGEFLSTNQVIEEQGDGLISVGIRFKGKQTSWDIGGFRPLSASGDDVLALPFMKATFVF